MTPAYTDGSAFRQALEARLRQTAETRGVPLNTLRQKVVMERLLARLFAEPDPRWRLKGGYAMELRLADRARTTRDLDLAAGGETDHDAILDELRAAAARDTGDFLVFAIAGPGESLAEQGAGGFRFGVTVTLGGRRYAGFHLDVGLDAAVDEHPERLACDDHLAFAGIAPAQVLVVSRERQFAEKLHAYTRPWGDRTNTRTKDLVDLLLLIDLGLDDGALRDTLSRVFAGSGEHLVPKQLPEPPASWASDFQRLAAQTGLDTTSLGEGFAKLAAFWSEQGTGTDVES